MSGLRGAATPAAALAVALAATGCAPALSTMGLPRTMPPGQVQAWAAVELSGLASEPARAVESPRPGLSQLQAGMRKGLAPGWEAGVRVSAVGGELEQKLQLARSPSEVSGVDVALATGIGLAHYAASEWDDWRVLTARVEVPVGLRLSAGAQVILSPRVAWQRWVPYETTEGTRGDVLYAGGSAALAWRLGAGHLFPELSLMVPLAAPGRGDPLHPAPVLVRGGVGYLFGG